MKSKNTPKDERIWPIGGCASLLVIIFATIGILLSMSQNLLELSALSENKDLDDAHELLLSPLLNIPAEYADLGVIIEDSDFPSLHIPDVPLDEISESPADPIGYLLRAGALYRQEDFTGAREAIVTGLPEDNQAIYLSSAARLAADSGDTEAALILSIAAVENARKESTALFNLIRPHAGHFIYETASTTELLDIATTLQEMQSSGMITEETIETLEASPIAVFAASRNLISNGNLLLAQRRLNRISEDSPLYAEFLLLKGELAIAQGETENAIEFLEAIDDLEDVPEWIESRAGELLDTLD